MRQGNFYFISDSFFVLHDQGNQLMKNKDNGHNRPCFYVLPDKKETDIFWCIPISSQIGKYDQIVQRKLDKQIARSIKKPKCSTIRFGEVLGQRKAFLIQNMFPVTESYITGVYIDKNTRKPVTIDPAVEKDIRKNASDVLKLIFRGYMDLVFSNVLKMREELILEKELIQCEKADRGVPMRPTLKEQLIQVQITAGRCDATKQKLAIEKKEKNKTEIQRE